MKNIVYFIGAGFSVPAGLPVLSNFLFRSREQFQNNAQKYEYFGSVFKYIDSLSKAKNFVSVDLFNIEEIFSIADTHSLLKGSSSHELERFIKDVIDFYTPPFKPDVSTLNTNNIRQIFFGDYRANSLYIPFVSSLLGLAYSSTNSGLNIIRKNISVEKKESPEASYKIISLNYDNIIERCVSYINETFSAAEKISIGIAKLHGSVDKKIIPPTWNKRITDNLEKDWKNAALWLSEATEIRILGYSLPKTDMYIRHLFSTALVESNYLQKIDVMCIDGDGGTEARYNDMFCFPHYSFHNIDLAHYISQFRLHFSTVMPLLSEDYNSEQMHTDAMKYFASRQVN